MNNEKQVNVFRAMKWAIYPKSEGYGGDYTTEVEIQDEGGGEFVYISQPFANTSNKGLAFEQKEWEQLKTSVDQIFSEIREHGKH